MLARAQAKGLLQSGKKKPHKEQEVQEPQPSVDLENGEVPDGLTNGHHDIDSKLLHKRSRKTPRRVQVRSTLSAPQYNKLTSYCKPHTSSPIQTYITTSSTSAAKQRSGILTQATTRSAMAIGTRLFHTNTKNSNSELVRRIKPIVAEHVKVVKHPAPFR